MSDLPKGWAQASIEEITTYVQRGKSPQYTPQSDLPVINQKCVRWSGVEEAHLKYVAPAQWGAWSEERFLRTGDILWNSTGTGTIGRAAVFQPLQAAPRAVADSHVTIIRTSDATFPDYLHRFIRSPEVQGRLEDMQSGSTNQVELSKSEVLATWVPLAPLAEQRRIVAKIDALSEASRSARARLDQIPRLVERYKQALLAAAFRGDLTPSDGPVWPFVLAGSIISDIVSGKNLRCEERPPKPDENGVVKVSAVSWGSFDATAAKTLPAYFHPSASSRIKSGDLLLARASGTFELVGAVVLVEQAPDNLFLSDKVLRLEMNASDKKWLMWFLRSPFGRRAIEVGASGGQLAMRNLSQGALKSILIPWPDFDQRQEIIRRIETAFAWIDRIAAEAGSARKLLDKLDQAVLTKAFRGELVPQDPADEPASLLLERIRKERAAKAEASPKAKRGRKPKSSAKISEAAPSLF